MEKFLHPYEILCFFLQPRCRLTIYPLEASVFAYPLESQFTSSTPWRSVSFLTPWRPNGVTIYPIYPLAVSVLSYSWRPNPIYPWSSVSFLIPWRPVSRVSVLSYPLEAKPHLPLGVQCPFLFLGGQCPFLSLGGQCPGSGSSLTPSMSFIIPWRP